MTTPQATGEISEVCRKDSRAADVGQVHLDQRLGEHRGGVAHRDRVVGERAGVEHHRGAGVLGGVQPLHQGALVLGLARP